MTRDEAVARIQRLLGWRGDKANEIVEELKNAQAYYERSPRLPWFLIDEVHRIQTADGEERIPVPNDFLREYEKGTLWYWNPDATEASGVWTNLAKEDVDYLRDTLPGEGAPQSYTIGGDYFRIFPTPDGAYWLKMVYYKQDTVLDDNIENDWLKWEPDLLIGYAGWHVAAALQNDRAMQIFAAMRDQAFQSMLVNSEAREHENFRYVMGGPD